MASGALLNQGWGAGSGKCRKMREQVMQGRWGRYSRWKVKNSGLADGNGGTVPVSLFCNVSKPEALLQRNVLLEAEFITTRLKSVTAEDLYVDRK